MITGKITRSRKTFQRLIDIRRRVGLKCNAAVQIQKAEDGCYAAREPSRRRRRAGACKEIDMSKPSLCMKLGPADWARTRARGGYQVEGHG